MRLTISESLGAVERGLAFLYVASVWNPPEWDLSNLAGVEESARRACRLFVEVLEARPALREPLGELLGLAVLDRLDDKGDRLVVFLSAEASRLELKHRIGAATEPGSTDGPKAPGKPDWLDIDGTREEVAEAFLKRFPPGSKPEAERERRYLARCRKWADRVAGNIESPFPARALRAEIRAMLESTMRPSGSKRGRKPKHASYAKRLLEMWESGRWMGHAQLAENEGLSVSELNLLLRRARYHRGKGR